MTAVEWLEMQIASRIADANIKISATKFFELINQAKEMEKQQIMDAIKFTIQDEFTKQTWKNGKCSHDTALNYYNNKFKNKTDEKRNRK